MTLTIDLTPTEEGRLTAIARQAGLAPVEAARRLLSDSLTPERETRERETRLVTEYHALTERE